MFNFNLFYLVPLLVIVAAIISSFIVAYDLKTRFDRITKDIITIINLTAAVLGVVLIIVISAASEELSVNYSSFTCLSEDNPLQLIMFEKSPERVLDQIRLIQVSAFVLDKKGEKVYLEHFGVEKGYNVPENMIYCPIVKKNYGPFYLIEYLAIQSRLEEINKRKI